MSMEVVSTIGRDSLMAVLKVSGPLLLTGLVVGVVVTMFQSVTQLRDMTLTFVPKIIGVGAALLIAFPWMLQTMIEYMSTLYMSIGRFGNM